MVLQVKHACLEAWGPELVHGTHTEEREWRSALLYNKGLNK